MGALSGVVDEELATLRAECGSLRTEVQQAVDLAKSQTEHTVNLIGESRRRDTEWMQLTYSQVKESVAKLDADVKECRAQLFELSGAHSSAVAKLGADAETHSTTLHRQVSALSERLAGTEARANTLVMEMDGSLRAEHDEVVRWMRDARPQLAALKGFESVQTLTESVHAHTAALQQRIDGSSTQLGMASEELARHRDALVLMVETVDLGLPLEQREWSPALPLTTAPSSTGGQSLARHKGRAGGARRAGGRGGGGERAARPAAGGGDGRAERRGAAAARGDAAGGAAAAGAAGGERYAHDRPAAQSPLSPRLARLSPRAPRPAGLLKLSTAHNAEWMKGVEREIMELKQEGTQCATQLRTMKGSSRDAVDLVNAHKASVRRAIDEVEKRHDAFARAAAVFADELKIANPLALAPS